MRFMGRFGALLGLVALVGCAQPVVFEGTTAPIRGQQRPQGAAPPTVRTAEQPKAAHASVGVDAVLSQSVFLAQTETTAVARIRVRPRTLESLPRPPMSVALVLDASGSMAGEPMQKAKEAALEFVEALEDTDRVSLVVFHSVTETLVPLSPLDDGGREQVEAAIADLEAVGTTDLLGGLTAGFAQVRQGIAQGGAARVVLLSDGRPNDASQILANVDHAARQGITVTALGLGLEYDEALLGSIAQRSGGKFQFAESPDQMAQLFRDEVLALRRVVGRNASLTVVPGPGVTIERVLGESAGVSGNRFVANLGDLVEGREREVLVLVKTEGHRDGAVIELLDAHLNFHDTLAGAGRTERTYLASKATASASEVSASRDEAVDLMTARALAADDTLRALALARSGQLKAARKLVRSAIRRAKVDARRFDDQALRTTVAELSELDKALPSLVARPARPRKHARKGKVRLEPMVSPGFGKGASPAGVRAAKRNHAAAMETLGYGG